MTDDTPQDLGAKLAVLTDDRPEPADPSVGVRLRIKRRKVRRRTTAAAVSAAAAVVVVVVASSFLGSVRSAEPGVATPSPSPSASSSPSPEPEVRTHLPEFTYTPLPQPWSDEPAFTTQPDSLKYAPAFYVARGSIPNQSWAVASYINPGCLVITDEGPAKAFGGASACFQKNWKPDRPAQYRAVPANVPNLSSPTPLTMVMGAVSAEARTVRITAGGKTYTTEAVGTPNSSRLRFFALVVEAAPSDITAVTPLTATGQTAPTPRGS